MSVYLMPGISGSRNHSATNDDDSHELHNNNNNLQSSASTLLLIKLYKFSAELGNAMQKNKSIHRSRLENKSKCK